jgi:hypothetical protein
VGRQGVYSSSMRELTFRVSYQNYEDLEGRTVATGIAGGAVLD